MTNKILVSINVLFLIIIVFLGYLQFFNSQKIAYVNSGEIISNYEGYKKATAEYQAKTLQWQTNIDTLRGTLEAEIAKYQKDKPNMSLKEKELSEKLIQSRRQQVDQYLQSVNQRAQEENRQMTAGVVTEINAFLMKYGEKRGYQLILATTNEGNIAYADKSLDITEEVLEELNNNYSGK